MTKAEAESVRERGNAPGQKVDRFTGKGSTPGNEVPLVAVGEHRARGITEVSAVR